MFWGVGQNPTCDLLDLTKGNYKALFGRPCGKGATLLLLDLNCCFLEGDAWIRHPPLPFANHALKCLSLFLGALLFRDLFIGCLGWGTSLLWLGLFLWLAHSLYPLCLHVHRKVGDQGVPPAALHSTDTYLVPGWKVKPWGISPSFLPLACFVAMGK